ncbi:signal peptidase I [Rhodococcus hoagii]|uniref:signal peptidase I n=1 Tax=Rhodococcus hoagii TaxID=43767 RepID=UPI0009B67BEE|nr:signal peptidase I [Prescottella equi]MDP8016394.1 signal peptidase I [Prescottella equi]NKR89817.1 signal peptidase I [Prescottella equi]NKS06611.1 signal peptidase I [Prescottella equi]NKS95424.1 signal peptidase I [Prescottella equi]NKT07482.1 signal peptidase I [Prescottella equi]
MVEDRKRTDTSRSRGWNVALNVGAVLGVVCVLATVVSLIFGIKPLIFRSGSMSPEIPTGALALSRETPAADLRAGDVVSVNNEQGTRITHRIDEILSQEGDSAVLILKGDANAEPDPSPYAVTDVDRLFFSVQGLGYVVSWLSSSVAVFLGGVLAGGLLMLAFGPAAQVRRNVDAQDPDSVSDSVL